MAYVPYIAYTIRRPFMRTEIHERMQANISTCTLTYLHVHYMHICMHTFCIRVLVHTCRDVCRHTRLHVYKHIHTDDIYAYGFIYVCVCTKQAESAHRTRLGEYTCTECTICGYIVACTWCCSIYLTHVFHISCCGVVAGREERKPRHHQEPQSSGQSRTTRTTLRSTMYMLNRPSQ